MQGASAPAGATVDLRLGRWQDVLRDVECDLLCIDAPYSASTHSGHDAGTRNDGGRGDPAYGHRTKTNAINYAPWSERDVQELVESWCPRTRGWFVSITDHHLAPVWIDALRAQGRYTFAPLPMVEIGSRVRLTGDGPSSWTCWVVVARPTALHRWGTLCGAYVYKGHGDRQVMGGKRLDAMRALVRDYSRQGDVVCDPTCGSGTTLLAASIERRAAIGAEQMPEHHAIALKRLARGYTPTFDFETGGAA